MDDVIYITTIIHFHCEVTFDKALLQCFFAIFVDVNLRHWFLLKSSLIFKTDRRLSVVNMSCYTEEIHVAKAREVVALGKKVDSDSSENG